MGVLECWPAFRSVHIGAVKLVSGQDSNGSARAEKRASRLRDKINQQRGAEEWQRRCEPPL